jgi:hypothetical protein
MNCERCNAIAGEPAVSRVRSDIIDLKVCRQCADSAQVLGLVVEPITEVRACSCLIVTAGQPPNIF